MNSTRVLLTCVGIACTCANAGATDLSNIERTIGKEPTYRNNSPTYGLLVFGPKATTRVWLVLDGKDLYVDKNCDGDLTGKGERFENDGEGLKGFEVADKSGKRRYEVTSISVLRLEREGKKLLMLSTNVTVRGKFRQYSGAMPSASRQDAPVSHFDGPMTLDINRDEKGESKQKFVTGEKPEELNVMIGTFDRKNGCWVVIENSKNDTAEDFPDALHPEAIVEFSSGKAGGDPIRIRNELSKRC